MANKTPNITHLKQGKAYPDPIATAKATGQHFRGTAKSVTITPTPDSKPGACDGRLGGDNTPDGRRGWAPINPAAAPNTYTAKGAPSAAKQLPG